MPLKFNPSKSQTFWKKPSWCTWANSLTHHLKMLPKNLLQRNPLSFPFLSFFSLQKKKQQKERPKPGQACWAWPNSTEAGLPVAFLLRPYRSVDTQKKSELQPLHHVLPSSLSTEAVPQTLGFPSPFSPAATSSLFHPSSDRKSVV